MLVIAVGMIIVLRSILIVVNVASRIVVVLVKRALIGQALAHHIGVGFAQQAIALFDLRAGGCHLLQLLSGKIG